MGGPTKFFQLTLYSQRFFIVGPRPVALHGVDVRSGPGAGPSPKPEAARPFTNRHPLPLAPRPGPGSGVPQEASQGVRGHLEKEPNNLFVKYFLNLFAPIREWGASGTDKADPRTDLSDRWSQKKCGPVVKPTKNRPEPWPKPKRKPMGRTRPGLNLPPRFI